MLNNLAVTLWNFKGGVGKSTIALTLAEIAAASGLRVLAVDLDEQLNLAHALNISQQLFPNIHVMTALEPGLADDNVDFFVIDTHPAKDQTIVDALNFADIVLVPVLCDYLSIVNLRNTIDFAVMHGVGKEQVAIIKNCMTNLKLNSDVEAIIDSQGYNSAGRLPRSNVLARNIASGLFWNRSMILRQREPFSLLYNNIWKAYNLMLAGNFHNLWGD